MSVKNPKKDLIKRHNKDISSPGEYGLQNRTGNMREAAHSSEPMSENNFGVREINREIDEYSSYRYTSTPSDSSSPSSLHSPHEDNRTRRDSNDSRDTVTSSATSSTEMKREKRLGKDERLAREKGITKYINTDDIINLPMDEFNERLEKAKLEGMNEEQYTTARDIRRRGKNKNAAQNCRKRANTRLDELKREVQNLAREKEELEKDMETKGKDFEEQKNLRDRWDLFILRHHGLQEDLSLYWVKDIGHCEEEFPFQIEDRRSPEMASYPRSERVVVQPRAVRPSPVRYFTNYLPLPSPHPYYVGDGGAVLYPVNSGSIEFFHTNRSYLPFQQVSLTRMNSSNSESEIRIKREEGEDLSKG